MRFGAALNELQNGHAYAIRLPDWELGVFIRIRKPNKLLGVTTPYLFMDTGREEIPWIPNMIELFREDWVAMV